MHWNKELAEGVEEKDTIQMNKKNNTTKLEFVRFGNWRNGERRKSRFKDDYYVSGLCNLVDNSKVN